MSFLITDPTSFKTAIKERWLAYGIGNVLRKCYRGRDWLVKVDIENDVATIHCPQISTQWGYTIHIDCPMVVIQYKAVKYAGELLERFNLSRSRPVDGDIESLPKNPLGYVKNVKEGGY
ncbi:MAG: hypothetical protein LPD71_00085 [Shewanella sp.]|nr:hypothetical protein [Shewanella sp.]MCF1437200.1 hypothetical protein [Shewanella sp.]MCF1459486.1 hypothetical protein [Shewanella sp.]